MFLFLLSPLAMMDSKGVFMSQQSEASQGSRFLHGPMAQWKQVSTRRFPSLDGCWWITQLIKGTMFDIHDIHGIHLSPNIHIQSTKLWIFEFLWAQIVSCCENTNLTLKNPPFGGLRLLPTFAFWSCLAFSRGCLCSGIPRTWWAGAMGWAGKMQDAPKKDVFFLCG